MFATHSVTKFFLLGLVVLVLQACTSSAPTPDTYYYVLDPSPKTATEKKTTVAYRVLPVELPNYMNQSNLVLKLSDHQIKISNYHYWANDLRKSVQRVVINELNQLNSQAGFAESCSNCSYTIIISIDHFYPSESGTVVLAGSYNINTDFFGVTTRSYPFSFSSTLDKGGYDESVSAMRGLLDKLSVQINRSLQN